MSDDVFSLPDLSEHTTIVGRTGSGKTQGLGWLLSRARFDLQPFIVLDTKHDALLNSIDRIREIKIGEIPRFPGLYIAHPLPQAHDTHVNSWLYNIWNRGGVGVVIDELTNMPAEDTNFQMLMSQGRSKHTPVYAATQRPMDVSNWVFSEARHVWLFALTLEGDRKKMAGFMPKDIVNARLPKFHSTWYNVDQAKAYPMLPVPQAEIIAEEINERLPERKRVV